MSALAEQLSSEPEFILVTADSELLPEYLARVASFCANNDPDANPEALVCSILEDSMADQHDYCLVAIMLNGKMVGHGLVRIYVYDHTRFANVLHQALDHGTGIEAAAIDGAVQAITEWAKARGCHSVQVWVDEGAQERRLRIFHKFRRDKIVMRRDL